MPQDNKNTTDSANEYPKSIEKVLRPMTERRSNGLWTSDPKRGVVPNYGAALHTEQDNGRTDADTETGGPADL